jgi:outer membrane immunogenic protein
MNRIRKIKHTLLLSLSFTALPFVAAAQQEHSLDVGAGYTYVHTNLLPGCNCFGMQGGSAQVQYALSNRIAAIGDVTVTHAANLSVGRYDLTQSDFTGGFRGMLLPGRPRLQPFGDVLAGVTHANGSLSPQRTGFGGGTTFAFEVGGGIQVPLSSRWTLMPAEVHYLLTTFGNGQADHQNDLRMTAGIFFRLRR